MANNTNITRWNPFRELAAMQSTMDRIMDDTWRDVRPFVGAHNLPLDIYESGDALIVKADVPGVTADNIDVNLHDNVLTISIDIPEPQVEEDTKALVQERFYGKLTRRFGLNTPVNADEIDAIYTDGVLTLTLPKLEEARPRQITIKSGNLISSN